MGLFLGMTFLSFAEAGTWIVHYILLGGARLQLISQKLSMSYIGSYFLGPSVKLIYKCPWAVIYVAALTTAGYLSGAALLFINGNLISLEINDFFTSINDLQYPTISMCPVQGEHNNIKLS